MRYTTLIAAFVLLVSSTLCLAADRPPNFVLIYCDDLGYADIGVHGGKDVPTPHIDALAAAIAASGAARRSAWSTPTGTATTAGGTSSFPAPS